MIKKFYILLSLLAVLLPFSGRSNLYAADKKSKVEIPIKEYNSFRDCYYKYKENQTPELKSNLLNSIDLLNEKLEAYWTDTTFTQISLEYKTPAGETSLQDQITKEMPDNLELIKIYISNDELDAADIRVRNLTTIFLILCRENSVYFSNRIQDLFVFAIIIILVVILIVLGFSIALRKINISNREHMYNSRQSAAVAADSADFSKAILEAQDTERTRLSHELHDTIAQDLRTIRLETELLKLEDTESKEKQKFIITTTTECINQLRSICYNLAPPELTFVTDQANENDINSNFLLNKSRLLASLHNLCGQFEYKTKIPCPMNVTDDIYFGKLTFPDLVNIFRIIQEALTNIEKHSKASHASVLIRNKVTLGKKEVNIFITDDGKGIPKSKLTRREEGSEHLGLTSMKERAALLGGTITFTSEEGDGTEVKISIPAK
ncbi:MAG: sensor histidine kinase [Treponema sp.]|nr:sensor histidine kinase [Treponema sp.]